MRLRFLIECTALVVLGVVALAAEWFISARFAVSVPPPITALVVVIAGASMPLSARFIYAVCVGAVLDSTGIFPFGTHIIALSAAGALNKALSTIMVRPESLMSQWINNCIYAYTLFLCIGPVAAALGVFLAPPISFTLPLFAATAAWGMVWSIAASGMSTVYVVARRRIAA